MIYRLMLAFLLVPLDAWTLSNDAEPEIPSGYIRVAREYGIPPLVLYTVALTESSLKLSDGNVRPWPWTLNSGSKTEYFRSRREAHRVLQHYLSADHRSIKVGPMQIDWSRHGDRLKTPWLALDPWFNLRIGAWLLRNQYQKTGRWPLAAARYQTSFKGKGLPVSIDWHNHRLHTAAVEQTANRYRLDPALLHAVIGAESAFNPKAVSPAGAQGLMQLMPATARRFGVANPFDPSANIEGGARYLRWLLDEFKDLRLALAGYNAGEQAVIRYGRAIPPYRETQQYVPRVLAFYRYFKLQGQV